MRKFTFAFLLCIAFAALAHESDDSDHFIRNVNELNQWCLAEAQYRYLLQNIPTYNWMSNTSSKGSIIYVKGQITAHHDHISVNCRANLGSRKEDAIIEIDDPSLPPKTIVIEPASGVNVIVR